VSNQVHFFGHFWRFSFFCTIERTVLSRHTIMHFVLGGHGILSFSILHDISFSHIHSVFLFSRPLAAVFCFVFDFGLFYLCGVNLFSVFFVHPPLLSLLLQIYAVVNCDLFIFSRFEVCFFEATSFGNNTPNSMERRFKMFESYNYHDYCVSIE
jgi:hypothetical protein